MNNFIPSQSVLNVHPSSNALRATIGSLVSIGALGIAIANELNSDPDNQRRDLNSADSINLSFAMTVISLTSSFAGYLAWQRYGGNKPKLRAFNKELSSITENSNDSLDKLEKFCEKINEEKLGNIYLCSLIHKFSEFKNKEIDFGALLDKAIPKPDNSQAISDLPLDEHVKLRKSLIESLKNGLEFDLNTKFPYQFNNEFRQKFQELGSKIYKKNDLSGLHSPDGNDFSTKDLFLMHALSFDKNPIKIEDFSTLFHDPEYRNALLDVAKKREPRITAGVVTKDPDFKDPLAGVYKKPNIFSIEPIVYTRVDRAGGHEEVPITISSSPPTEISNVNIVQIRNLTKEGSSLIEKT